MKVTYVIRGQEHLMNTPGQQELWKALGFGEVPQYVHMSVTISDSRAANYQNAKDPRHCASYKKNGPTSTSLNWQQQEASAPMS